MRAVHEILRDRSGASLVMVLLSLVALLGVGAVAVDAGMLMAARADAQHAADAAALAGASAFLDQSTPTLTRVQGRAQDVALENRVAGRPLQREDLVVQMDAAQATVRVTVRPSGVPAAFARALGVEHLRVGAVAAARVTDSPTAVCVKPFSPPDPLTTGGAEFNPGDAVALDGYDGAEMWQLPQTGSTVGPCPYRANSSPQSGPTLRSNICNCNRSLVAAKREYDVVRGQKVGPRRQGVNALLEQDPGAYWDQAQAQVAGSNRTDWRRSPRVVAVPLHNPARSGAGQLHFTRFVWVFLEQDGAGNRLTGRYVSRVRTVRLVQ